VYFTIGTKNAEIISYQYETKPYVILSLLMTRLL